MQTIEAFEAKTHPAAKLIATVPVHHEAKGNAIDALKNFSKHHRLGNLDWKDLRDEGRRCIWNLYVYSIYYI